jgi:hypothetical protein
VGRFEEVARAQERVKRRMQSAVAEHQDAIVSETVALAAALQGHQIVAVQVGDAAHRLIPDAIAFSRDFSMFARGTGVEEGDDEDSDE